MACLTEEDIKVMLQKHKNNNVLRDRSDDNTKYPDLPAGKCVPGKIYKKGCRKCFCNDKSEASCSEKKKGCDVLYKSSIIDSPEDIHAHFSNEELESLPVLPSAAAKCEPGKAYKVDCNPCLCMSNRNLFCAKMLCLSLDDMQRIKAIKLTGKSCKKNENLTERECIRCLCVNELTRCKVVPDCKPKATRMLHGEFEKRKPRLKLNMNTDKCLPHTVYKDNCNKCYCQMDGSLRCTQKTCLNYVQSLVLNKHRLYLQKHGI